MGILEALKQLQNLENEPDKAFASRLKYTRTYWTKVRNNRLPVTDEFRDRVVECFPRIQGVFLSDDIQKLQLERENNIQKITAIRDLANNLLKYLRSKPSQNVTRRTTSQKEATLDSLPSDSLSEQK